MVLLVGQLEIVRLQTGQLGKLPLSGLEQGDSNVQWLLARLCGYPAGPSWRWTWMYILIITNTTLS